MRIIALPIIFLFLFMQEAVVWAAETNNDNRHVPSVVQKMPAITMDNLLSAIDAGDVKKVKYLASNIKKLDVIAAEGLSPLHYAVFYNNAEIVEILLLNGAKPNFKTDDLMTSLDISVLNNQQTVSEILKKFGGGISPSIAEDLKKFGCKMVYDPKDDVYNAELKDIFAVMKKINAEMSE